MPGKVGFRGYPRHLGRPRFRGLGTCERSGFVRHADRLVEDERGGLVAEDKADVTPGFGTKHPQDVVQLPPLDDPTPVVTNGLHEPEELEISDAERWRSVREGRPPRPGY